MSDQQTFRVSSSRRSVKGIRVEVQEGRDAGRSAASEAESMTVGTAQDNDLVLTDPTVSRYHLTLGRKDGRLTVLDHATTNGTRIGPILLRNARVELDAGTRLELGATKLVVGDGEEVVHASGPSQLGGLVGGSAAMRALMETAATVAKSDVQVLLLGESGTGKELIARAVHDSSPRADQPFVTVDCAALSPTLFASELFGHERGAFTGADRRHIGAFERANGGAVFLDEVGELPPDLQSALLGVLERRLVKRLGGVDEIPVNVRLVSATHRDLLAEVNAGTFRLDLFYRLAIVRIPVPPLRERREDVPLLIEHFLRDAGHAGSVRDVFPPETLKVLNRHSWPGNVRELRNTVLGALALGKPPELLEINTNAGSGDPFAAVLGQPYRDAKRVITESFERRYLEDLMQRTEGNVRAAAREGKMDRKYLTELLRRHGLK